MTTSVAGRALTGPSKSGRLVGRRCIFYLIGAYEALLTASVVRLRSILLKLGGRTRLRCLWSGGRDFRFRYAAVRPDTVSSPVREIAD